MYQVERNKIQLLFNGFSDAVLFESSERIVEFVNESYCSLFKIKFAPDSIIGTNCEDGIIAASFQFKNPSRFIYRIEEIIEEALPIKAEQVFLRDGRFLLRDYTPISINDKVIGHLWIYKEVVQTVNQIEIANGWPKAILFDYLLNNIKVGISVLNNREEYLFVNETDLPDAGKRSFIIGKTESEYFAYNKLPFGEKSYQSDLFYKVVNEGVSSTYEYFVRDLNGNYSFKEITLYPLLNEEGIVEGVIKYAVDISEQKEKNLHLKKVIQQYEQALNNINDLVVITNKSLDVNFINHSFLNKFKAIDDKIHTLFNHIPLNKYEFYKHVFSVLEGGDANVQGKMLVDNKTEKKTWYNYFINQQDSTNENKQGGIVAILNDVTGKVELEENLLEVVKREKELNEIKSAFVNMVSHEMRTPLAIISSSAEIVQMMLANGKPKEDIDNYINQIISEVERMTAFMNDILMISKIEAGKIEFYPESVSLYDFIYNQLLPSYSPFKDSRNLELNTKGLEHTITFDGKMLRHVLQNLIDNAFKYSFNKQNPRIRLRYSKTYVTISIVDNGIGIHPEDINKLFASFSRGRNVANIAGTGIGLVVVKYFVDQHNGVISIKSKLNKGSVFSIKIPYK